MLAVPRHDSGSERDGEDAIWDEIRFQEGAHTSEPFDQLHHLMRKSTIKDVSRAKSPRYSPTQPDGVQAETSQSEQKLLAVQKSIRKSSVSYQKRKSWPETPPSSLQNGWQETSDRSALASPDAVDADSLGEPAHTHSNERRFQEPPESLETVVDHLSNSKQTQIRNESLDISVGRPLATSSRLSFRRKKPPPFPNPQDSLGEMIQTKNKKIKGKVWIAEGPALELFKTRIRPQIEKILQNAEPPQCAPLFLPLYMIGKKETSATPIIMICCCDRKARKEAEALVRESDILQQFPQMGLGHSANLLETNDSVVPVTGRPLAKQMADQNPASLEIHGLGEPVIGRRLRFVKFTDGREVVRFATGGPFIRIEKQIYQLAAYHMGQVDIGTDLDVQFDSDPDDCEYDGQYDTDEGDSDFEEATTRNRSMEPKHDTALEAEVAQLAKKANSDLASDLWSPQDVTGVDRAHLSGETVDYFLVKLPADEASKASNIIKRVGNNSALEVTNIAVLAEPGTQVVVVTSYRELTGFILPGAQRVKMNGFYGFQNLLAVRLSVPIRIGDSGSAVFDTSTGCFYGHIVLASAPDTIAYIVPSVDIFTEISTRFGEFPTLDMVSSILNEEKPSRAFQQEHGPVDAPGSVSHLLDHVRKDSRSPDSSESVKSNSSRSDSLQLDLDESSRPLQATETGHPPSSPRYEIYSSDEFEPGDVFKTLWSEPFAPSDTFPSKDFQSPGIWTGPRVFIVVRSGDDHSLCVPIRTYGKMGCTKSGVRPHQHGIVYDKSSQPELLPGEPKLGFSPIRFESWSQECIGKEARVDYSCFTTVEHDIGVAFIGAIMYDDWWIVQDAVDSCWDNSRGHRDKSKEKRSQQSARASHIATTYGFPVQKASPGGFEEQDLSDWDPIYSANTFWSTYGSIGEPE